MIKKKILLVEDNRDDILLIERVFNKSKLSEKFDLVVAQDGNQAVSYLKDLKQKEILPMILLLDLKLPRVDGFEVLQRIRKNEKTQLIPVIVFTSSKEEKDITKAYLLGANSYVRKPIDSEKFISVLQQIISYWGDINEISMKQ
ncbi:MAG: response regulator, partial [Candidatus Thermoplasmatota archaeon]|nr:response regulator [Candidatus Thermoplasmatota archaeon]